MVLYKEGDVVECEYRGREERPRSGRSLHMIDMAGSH